MEDLRKYFSGSYKIRILLASLICAIVADGVVTNYLVFNGLAFEGNPFLRFWVGHDDFLTIKFLGGLLASLYLWSMFRRYPNLSIGFSSLCLAAYTFILFWNLLIIF
jgi:hypothetical protein